jgi:cobalt-zinc-cadmium efflux system membrane fusion protein
MKLTTTFALLLVAGSLLAGCQEPDTPAGNVAPAEDADGHDESGEESHEGEEHAEGVVSLTEQQIADAQIEVSTAGPARIRETLPLYGVIAPNAVAMRHVTARFPGVIHTISKSFGDSVTQDEILATVESNESLQRYNVTSPLTGVVIGRDANLGEQSGDRVLFTVADLSSVWVELALFARDIGKVKVDQVVRVRGADPGASADGRVIWIAPFGTSTNQTLTARVLLDNPERRWAPGLYVTAEITLAETDVPLAVHNDALQTLDARTVVFVRDADGFEPHPVEIGRRDGDYTEVISGISPGDSYVARNSFIIKAELGKGEAEHEH